MAYSTQRAVSDGTLVVLDLSIEFFDKSEITAYVSDIPEPFGWDTGNRIRFLRVIPQGLEVLVRRTTDLSQVRHIFSLGAQFKNSTIDEDFRQILHISQEAVEGAGVGDLYAPLNMHGNVIRNVGPAVADGDAISLGQVKTESASAWVAAGQAQAAAAGVATDAAAAKAAKDRAVLAEANADASATSAAASANTATTAVAGINASVQAAAGSATAAAASAATATTEAGKSKTSADAAAASALQAAHDATAVNTAALQLGMQMFGHRAHPFAGFTMDDGQELERSLYPDFAAVLDAGHLPTVTEVNWQANPSLRGCFVAVSSPGKFRMRDLNGMSSGSLGPAFRRGSSDPYGGKILRFRMQDHQHVEVVSSSTPNGGEFPAGFGGETTAAPGPSGGTGALVVNRYRAYTSGVVQVAGMGVGAETYPTHVQGAWMTRIFGQISPLGAAEANSLATSYAALASRVGSVESRVGAVESTVATIKRQSINLPASTSLFNTVSHSLGEAPWRYSFVGFLTSAVGGWPAGTRVEMGGLTGEANYVHGLMVVNANATSFAYKCANSGFAMSIMNSGGAREWLRFDQVSIVALVSTY